MDAQFAPSPRMTKQGSDVRMVCQVSARPEIPVVGRRRRSSLRISATLFFQLISRRYERGPMILTSNQSFGSLGRRLRGPRDHERDSLREPASRDDDQHPGRFVSAEGQAEVRGGQADDSGSVSDGTLWTLPAMWKCTRDHNALDRPQTACPHCPQPPQALNSSMFSTRGGGIFDDRGGGILNDR